MPLSRRSILRAAALAPAFFVHCGRARRRGGPPNVLLILADDVGADAVSCCGAATFATPSIDRLAREGLRFDASYATPLCVPSRAQLLTGCYPFRTGFTANILAAPAGRGVTPFLPSAHRTIARELKDRGYATAVAGKWHLCSFEERPGHPRELGFDEYLCWLWMERGDGAAPDWSERYFDPGVIENGAIRRRVEGAFGPELYADFLLRFIERNRDAPFFAYYATVLPHAPWQMTPRELGGVPAVAPPSDAMSFPRSLAALDREVERLVGALRALGLERETLVLFTSDNGTPEEVLVRRHGRLRPGGKGTLCEAGTRVPLIARLPGTIAAGRVIDAPVDSTDLLPTFVELAGVAGLTAPAAAVARDGRSFAPALRGEPWTPRAHLLSQLRESWAIRGDRFKLYSDGRLFDVVADPLEDRDLSGEPGSAPIRGDLAAAASRLRDSR